MKGQFSKYFPSPSVLEAGLGQEGCREKDPRLLRPLHRHRERGVRHQGVHQAQLIRTDVGQPAVIP